MNLIEDYILTEALQEQVQRQPESGRGYRIVRVLTRGGAIFDNVIVVGGYRVNGIYGYDKMPFSASDITDIKVTHLARGDDFEPQKWFFIEE